MAITSPFVLQRCLSSTNRITTAVLHVLLRSSTELCQTPQIPPSDFDLPANTSLAADITCIRCVSMREQVSRKRKFYNRAKELIEVGRAELTTAYRRLKLPLKWEYSFVALHET